MLPALGQHVIAELYGCAGVLLDDAALHARLLQEAVQHAHMHLCQLVVERFQPIGLTACAVLSESHLTVHTFPELGYCAIDAFTCGQEGDPLAAVLYIATALNPQRQEVQRLVRGPGVQPQDIDELYMAKLRTTR